MGPCNVGKFFVLSFDFWYYVLSFDSFTHQVSVSDDSESLLKLVMALFYSSSHAMLTSFFFLFFSHLNVVLVRLFLRIYLILDIF